MLGKCCFFIPRHFKKVRGIMLYPSSKNCVRVSVRPSVCLSVRQRLVFTLYRMHFSTNFLQTWYKSWYWGGVSWDCRWVNFDKYVELWPLIYVINWFSLSIFGISLPIFSNFAWELKLGRSIFGLQMGKFRQICTELWPLIYVINWFLSLSLAFLYRFSSNFAWEFILGSSVLGLQMC